VDRLANDFEIDSDPQDQLANDHHAGDGEYLGGRIERERDIGRVEVEESEAIK
jgi:hypothetical protein